VLNADTSNSIAIYPNPNDGKFIIDIQLFSEDNIVIDVRNLLGENILLWKENNIQSKYKKSIDLQQFSAGIYFIHIRFEKGNKFFVKKLIKN